MSDELSRLLTGIPEDIRVVNSRGAWRRAVRSWLLDRVAVPFSQYYGPRQTDTFGILMYHRVARPIAGVPAPSWSVTPTQLREQLSGLKERGFQAWPLEKILAYRIHGKPLPPRTYAVTFDDGYENNITLAWPVLRELDVPATVFLATRYVDSRQPFPFDDWTAAGSHAAPPEMWRPLSMDQCRELRDSGLVSLGAHTHTHGDFRERPFEFAMDLEQCLETLSVRFGIEQPTLALPYGCRALGTAGPMFSRIAEQVGCTTCLSTEAGLSRLTDDPFAWGRFEASSRDTAATLAAKLDGWWDQVRETLRLAKRVWSGSLPRRFEVSESVGDTVRPAMPMDCEILELPAAVGGERV